MKPRLTVILVTFTAAGAFALGWISRTISGGGSATNGHWTGSQTDSIQSGVADGALAKNMNRALDASDETQAGESFSPEAVTESMNAIVNTRNPVKQAAMFAALLGRLTPGNAMAAFEALREDRDGFGKMNGPNMQLLLNAWGQIDGIGALEALNAAAVADRVANGGRGRDNHGNGNDPERDYFSSIYHTLSGLAAVDPAAAAKYLNSIDDVKQRDKLMAAIVDGILVDGVENAVGFIAANTDEDAGRQRYMAAVAKSVLEGGVESATAWLDALPKEMRTGAIDQVANRYAREDLAGAVDWISKYAGEPYATHSLDKVAESWAESDPRAASDWATELPADAQPGVYREAMDEWAESDPAAASEYLSQLPKGIARDSAVEGFAKELVKTDPKSAAAWAETIVSEPQHQSALSEVARSWLKTDPANARTWIEGQGLATETFQAAPGGAN